MSEPKDEPILVKRKIQRYVGWENSINDFFEMVGKELTWLSKLFNDAKGEGTDCKGGTSSMWRGSDNTTTTN